MSGQHGSYGHEHHHGHSEHQHGHGGHPAIAAANLVTDPVCGMKVDPATSKHRIEHARADLPLLLGRVPDEVRGRSGEVSASRRRRADPAATAKGAIYTCPMHPRDPAGWARATARSAAWRWSRWRSTAEAGPEPRARGHDPAVLDRAGADLAGRSSLEMGGHIPALGLHHLVPPRLSTWIQFLLATPVVLWAGWPFFVRGWAVAGEPQPQHVHPDRARDRGGLPLQPGRHPRAGRFPGGLPRHGRHGAGLLRGRRRHHRPRPARAGAGAAGARADRRRHPRPAEPGAEDRRAASGRTARTRRSPSTEVQVGDRLRVRPGRGRAGGRRGAGGPRRRRRIDGHRRIHAGREAARRQGHRRHGQRHRRRW